MDSEYRVLICVSYTVLFFKTAHILLSGSFVTWDNLFLKNKDFNMRTAEDVKDKASVTLVVLVYIWAPFHSASDLRCGKQEGSGACKQHRKPVAHQRKQAFFYWVLSKSLLLQPVLSAVSRWDHPIIPEGKTKIYLLSKMPQFAMFLCKEGRIGLNDDSPMWWMLTMFKTVPCALQEFSFISSHVRTHIANKSLILVLSFSEACIGHKHLPLMYGHLSLIFFFFFDNPLLTSSLFLVISRTLLSIPHHIHT